MNLLNEKKLTLYSNQAGEVSLESLRFETAMSVQKSINLHRHNEPV